MWTSLSRPAQLRERLAILALLGLYVGVAVQQRNPLNNFCRRWGHQTAIVDNKLYIDGGLVTYDSSKPPQNFTNQYIIYHDLTQNSSTGMPPPYANLTKNGTIPSVNGGILWPDEVNKRIYLYGGEFYDETPWPFSLYAYDILNDHWDDYGAPRGNNIGSLSYGAGLSISSRGEAYYYGGWMNNRTTPGWGNAPGIPTSYMLRYSMDTKEWTNTTGPDTIGRAEGVMIYLPAGDAGMIIYFGGIRDKGNGTWEGQPMEEIMIYDILSGKSYIQNATGHIPELRRRFCAGATWPEDQSSYNIYLYGGAGEQPGSVGFDDIYVLSIPTFTWIRMYPLTSNATGDYPHHSLSCNVVNGAQMLIHGGFFPLNDDCDAPTQWGLHNLDMGKQNPDGSVWALYDPDKTKYVVPSDIVDVVGGSGQGGATKTAPADGFDHQDLKVLMTRKASAAVRTPTRDVPEAEKKSDKKSLSTGAIVGIAVGGAVGLIGIIVGALCLLRRRRNRTASTGAQQPMTNYSYHHPPQASMASNQYSQGPWSPQSSHFTTASPPPFQHSPAQTVPPHTGPPVELPSGNTNEIPMVSPYTETPQLEPKYDAHGNLWIPQVSMVQVPSQQGHSPGGSPMYDGTMGPGTVKYDDPGRTLSPQELDTQTRQSPQGPGSPTHQTYYHP